MDIGNILSYAQISRQHGISGKKIYNTSKKLASGYKISQAADGSAALSISEKMRAQIRGLDQGVQNAQDAYSTLQVIDGKAQSANDLLQRMRELTLQAVNGTNTDQDRMLIQQEISKLREELGNTLSDVWEDADLMILKCDLDDKEILQRIRNYDFPILKQDLYDDHNKTIPLSAGKVMIGNLGLAQFFDDLIQQVEATPASEAILTAEFKNSVFTALQKWLPMVRGIQGAGGDNVNWDDVADIIQKMKELPLSASAGEWNSLYDRLGAIRDSTEGAGWGVWRFMGIIGASAAVFDTTQGVKENVITQLGTARDIVTYSTYVVATNLGPSLPDHPAFKDFQAGNYGNVYRGLQDMAAGRNYDGSLRAQKQQATYEMNVQAGANAGHAIKVAFSMMRFEELPWQNVLSDQAANKMLDALDQTLKGMADFLSTIGSYQNRLQYAMEYAMEHAEIETGAESRIRDADYGKEAAENVKQNLQQQVQETLFTKEKQTKEQMNHFLF